MTEGPSHSRLSSDPPRPHASADPPRPHTSADPPRPHASADPPSSRPAQPPHTHSLGARWRYRANLVWDRGTWPVLLAVGSLTLLVVIASTAVLVITNSVFTTEHGRSIAERFWQSLLRVIDPGTMATDIGWGPRLLSLLVTIFGIVLFGTLIGTISTVMQLRLGTLRRGRTVVLEAGHVVILGWSPWVGLLVGDLTVAVSRRRRQTIVILADEDRASMEELLRATIGDRRGAAGALP